MGTIKRVDVMQEDWDYLIILDACRYDYFEKTWRDFFSEGNLFRKRSVASCTDEWRNISFPGDYDDVVYISANPHFCSDQAVRGFCAGDHFFKVYDVWKDGWDSDIGTVRPETLTDAALDILRRCPVKDKRFIIHYLQPHAPYLSLEDRSKGHRTGDINQRDGVIGDCPPERVSKIRKWFYNLSCRIFNNTEILGKHPSWTLRKFFKLPARTPMEYTLRMCGIEQLRAAYEANLKSVLSEAVRLVRCLSGTIIITSDHGEFLGEKKCFSHPKGSEDPIVREIPWFIIQRENAEISLEQDESLCGKPQDDSGKLSEEAVIERLRLLGYHD